MGLIYLLQNMVLVRSCTRLGELTLCGGIWLGSSQHQNCQVFHVIDWCAWIRGLQSVAMRWQVPLSFDTSISDLDSEVLILPIHARNIKLRLLPPGSESVVLIFSRSGVLSVICGPIFLQIAVRIWNLVNVLPQMNVCYGCFCGPCLICLDVFMLSALACWRFVSA